MRNRKNVIIIVMIVFVLLMITGYAAFRTQLNINATGNITTEWNVYFESISEGTPVGGAINNFAPNVTGTTAVMSADFSLPGDSMTYDIKLVNKGTIDAVIEDIEAISEGYDMIVFSIEGIKKGDKLKAKSDITFQVTIKFDDVTSYPGEVSTDLTVNIKTVQDTGQTIDIEDVVIESKKIYLSNKILGEGNSNLVTSGDGLYVSTATNDGRPTYYYHGNVENNYVSFANLTWRVVRINEDGTIKLILDEIINNTTYLFNPNSDNYKYMYYSESNVTNGIKNTIDNWYNNTLKTNYDSYIATTSFCESAKVKVHDFHTSGNATMELSSNYTPNYKCELDGNNKQYVTEKVGLITADEVAMAGIPLLYSGMTSSEYNKNTYLQKSYYWWTMSPAGFYDYNNYALAFAWLVDYNGDVGPVDVDLTYSVRPVISLNADTLVEGSGASDDMWVVQMK